MIRPIRYISVLCLLLLSSVYCRAERDPVIHDFSADASNSAKLTFHDTYHVARTPLLIYKCTSGSVFGQDLFSAAGSKKISINYSGSNQVMTTSAVDSLAGLEIYYYYQTSPRRMPSFELTLSRDSVHWSQPIELDDLYTVDGRLVFNFVPGRYHVRLKTTGSYSASIFKIKYSFGWCNCFLYIPE